MTSPLKAGSEAWAKLFGHMLRWPLQPFIRLQEERRRRAQIRRQVQYAVATQWLVERLRAHEIEVLEYGLADSGPRVRANVRPDQVADYRVVYAAAGHRFPELTVEELRGAAEPRDLLNEDPPQAPCPHQLD